MAVTDWLGLGSPFQGGSDSLNAPLLSYVSDDDPAADSSTSSDPRDDAESESESESNPAVDDDDVSAADDDDDVTARPRDPRDANAAAACTWNAPVRPEWFRVGIVQWNRMWGRWMTRHPVCHTPAMRPGFPLWVHTLDGCVRQRTVPR